MPTLILIPRHSVDTQRLWKAAAELGWGTERLAGWRVPAHLRELADPVFYGEALLGPAVAEQLGLTLMSPPADWLPRLPEAYRRRAVRLMTLGEARALPGRHFVKPPNLKSFPAAVYGGDGGDASANPANPANPLPTDYPDSDWVLVAEVVRFTLEYRCFVQARKLVDFSLYAREGDLQEAAGYASLPEEDAAALGFLHVLLADPAVELPEAVVVDIGCIAGRGWACVELNAPWGAGIYGCDPRAVLPVIRASARGEGAR